MVKLDVIEALISTLNSMNIDLFLKKEKYGDEEIYTNSVFTLPSGARYVCELGELMISNYNTAVMFSIVNAIQFAAEIKTKLDVARPKVDDYINELQHLMSYEG